MELVLNLAWVLLSATLIAVWCVQDHRNPRERRRTAVALLLLALILLPAISMTDDLLATRFSAEVEQVQLHHKLSMVAHAGMVPAGSQLAVLTAAPLRTALRFTGTVETVTPQSASQQFARVHGIRPPPAA